MTFQQWWDSDDNPATKMPESTKQQIKWHMQEAWKAGIQSVLDARGTKRFGT